MRNKTLIFPLLVLLLLQSAPVYADIDPGKKAVILGIDGMDPNLLQKFMDEGKLPNFKKLATESGSFKKLGTSFPPQSPVAWSNFAIGANPGKHGIYDFIHRHPESVSPYLSITETTSPKKFFNLGDWQIPLDAGSIKNLRGGKAFWEYLCENKVPSTICQVPANYPPQCPCQSDKFKALSGMGTPDLLGTQGTFSFYTTEEMKLKKVIGGGKVYNVQVVDGRMDAKLFGPSHPYKNPAKIKDKEKLQLSVPFTLWVDESNPMAKLKIQNQEIILKRGEFSPWITVSFEVIPFVQKITAICRFYLKETSPHLKLYVTPLNVDPSNPAIPISQPAAYVKELSKALGPFYTQNMPPDTKALEHKMLSEDEFLQQIGIVLKEEEARLQFELQNFKDGVLFHYFGVLDQLCHVFWRFTDPQHPLYTEELHQKYGKTIEDFYVKFDNILGQTMQKIDKDTLLIVMSDHGFTSFRRGVNLNTILLNKGFISLIDPAKQEGVELFLNVDWSKTKAYNLGINALYINLENREESGSVSLQDYDAVIESIRKTLLEYVDPKTGTHPIKMVARKEEVYSGPYLDKAPDLVIGYEDGYRASWDTILGEMPKEEIVDNTNAWSGDHTIDFHIVPGVVLANRSIVKESPSLVDLAPTILDYFGITDHQDMEGQSIFNESKGA